MHIDEILSRTLDDPDRAVALMAAIADARPAGRHLDAEQVAAAAEGNPEPRCLAHALDCAVCAEQIERAADLLGVDALPLRRVDALDLARLPRALFATFAATEDGGFEIARATGSVRVQPALTVRAARPAVSMTLRDRAVDPIVEIGVVTDGRPDRLSLLVRWLGRDAEPRRARATSAGRVVAESDLREGAALLSGLRRADVRLDVLRDSTVEAVAWLRMEPA